MNIQRINSYTDDRFTPEILRQHGAFLIDGKYPCGFEIVDDRSAKMYYHDYEDTEKVEEILEAFRFYTGHITRFYTPEGDLLKEYEPVKLFDLPLREIQPSQFYVDQEKLAAVGSFIQREEDIVIPVMEYEGSYVSEDGHTRLYLAHRRGYARVRAFLEEEGTGYIPDFVEEARSRGIYHVGDMTELSHEEYEEKWNRFCDAFFARLEEREDPEKGETMEGQGKTIR
ncbi:MAG: hypothetical protein J6B43_10235 [Lachnospiraceae bacterium]|nr:hypothetical protein [Lachnospiraceae bacterium]